MKRSKILLVSFMIILATVINLFAGMISVGAESTAPTYGGGSGTQEDPYKISTAEHLKALAAYTNSCTADNGQTTKGLYFELQNDIAIGEGGTQADWTPIGIVPADNAADPSFRGHFDGNGHTISGFKISSTTAADNQVMGLFGVIRSGASIKDLRVANATVNMEKNQNVGVIVGLVNWESTVSGCSTASDVKLIATGMHNHDLKLGGIAGYVHEKAVVEYCENNAAITIESTTYSKAYAAGIAGGSASTIKNCVNKGTITVKGYEGKTTTTYAAGIVGQINPWGQLVATVENCINYATVANEAVGDEDNIYYASGIIACVMGGSTENRVFKNNFNLGKIDAGYVGQIVGVFNSSTYTLEANYGTKGLGWAFGDDDGLGMEGMTTIPQADILANTSYLAAVQALDNNMTFELGAYTLPTGFAEEDPELPSFDDLFGDDEEDEETDEDDKDTDKKNNTATETTEAVSDTAETAADDAEGGCGSAIGLAILPVFGLIGAVALVSKKKED